MASLACFAWIRFKTFGFSHTPREEEEEKEEPLLKEYIYKYNLIAFMSSHCSLMHMHRSEKKIRSTVKVLRAPPMVLWPSVYLCQNCTGGVKIKYVQYLTLFSC